MIYVDRDYGGRLYRDVLPIELPITGNYTEVMFCPFCRDLQLQVDVAGMVSGESVTITVEGSLDNVGYDNLAASGLATTITENGTTLITFDGAATPYIKVKGESDVASGSEMTTTIKGFFPVMGPG